MNKDPKVTFIVPAYNAGAFLPEAIESVRRQTVRDWAMIIIDDCSSDNTYDIAREYASEDARITVLRTDSQSGGVFEPRKKGIMYAETDLVSPLDADDCIAEDYLERLLAEKEKLAVRAIYPTLYRMHKDADIPLMDRALCGQAFKGRDCVALTLDGWRINCGGGIIDRDVYLHSFDQFDNPPSCYKDEILTRYILWTADNVAFSTAKYLYRNNPDSVTHTVSAKQFDFLINNRELLKFAIDRYGPGSEEHILAARQNFHGIADYIRVLRNDRYPADTIRYAESQLKESYKLVDWKLIWRHNSKWYWLALRGGLNWGKTGMKLLDALRSVKK